MLPQLVGIVEPYSPVSKFFSSLSSHKDEARWRSHDKKRRKYRLMSS
jgi:hypothetical protein